MEIFMNLPMYRCIEYLFSNQTIRFKELKQGRAKVDWQNRCLYKFLYTINTTYWTLMLDFLMILTFTVLYLTSSC